jgi:hypothetical protein
MAAVGEPLFKNSVVSNRLDFIKTSDPSAFHCIAYDGEITAEMPGAASGGLLANGVFAFTAQYTDGSAVPFWVHYDIGSSDAAAPFARKAAEAVGKLPTFMRAKLNHVVIHGGDGTAFAEDRGRFFVLYAQNMRTRMRDNDLEETVFHEAVHATLDIPYLKSAAYTKARKADGAAITEYARKRPTEDMAESALFAWALTQHPGRLPARIERRVREIMPNRLAFFAELFSKRPRLYRVGPKRGC